MTAPRLLVLVHKEAHHLLPLLCGLLALEFVGLLDAFFGQSPDELSWLDFSLFFSPDTLMAQIILLAGVVAAYMMLSAERSSGTLRFLWGMPMARRNLFLLKMLTAFGVLSLYTLFSQLLGWGLQNFGASTMLNEQFSWRLWALELLLINGLLAIGLGYGALAAWFRTAGTLVLVGGLFGAGILSAIEPSLSFVDPGTLTRPEFRGAEMILPVESWLFHGICALASMAAALLLWTRHSEFRAGAGRGTGKASRLLGAAFYLGAFVLISIYMGDRLLPQGFFQEGIDDGGGTLAFVESDRFLFSHYRADEVAARQLAADAPRLADAVQAQLGAALQETTLVDLTDQSQTHLGIAGWKRMRVTRSSLLRRGERDRVFVHELSHVLADQLADGQLSEQGAAAAFFSEGLAEWVTFRIIGRNEEYEALRELAALAWHRLSIRFDDLLDASAFGGRFDEALVYAVGLAWVDALAASCGDEAPGDVLRAMARPELSRGAGGRLFWQLALQAAGCDLVAVNNRFAADMEALSATVESLPSVLSSAGMADGELRFSLTLESSGDTAYDVVVRVRDNARIGLPGLVTRGLTLAPGQTGELSVPASLVSGERFQYQVGLVFREGQRVFFGPWLSGG